MKVLLLDSTHTALLLHILYPYCTPTVLIHVHTALPPYSVLIMHEGGSGEEDQGRVTVLLLYSYCAPTALLLHILYPYCTYCTAACTKEDLERKIKEDITRLHSYCTLTAHIALLLHIPY
jgi:hypothetical protein